MAKPVATAIFAGPYGGEETGYVRKAKSREGAACVQITPPGYVRIRAAHVADIRRRVERCHNFIRWEG